MGGLVSTVRSKLDECDGGARQAQPNNFLDVAYDARNDCGDGPSRPGPFDANREPRCLRC